MCWSPSSDSSIVRTALTSSARRINEAAIKSTSRAIPNRISSSSSGDSDGRPTSIPGSETRFRLVSRPPTSTLALTSFPATDSTTNTSLPSSRSILSPFLRSSAIPSWLTPICALLHLPVSPLMMICRPSISTAGSSIVPIRISGPLVSRRIAVWVPSRFLAFLILAMSSA